MASLDTQRYTNKNKKVRKAKIEHSNIAFEVKRCHRSRELAIEARREKRKNSLLEFDLPEKKIGFHSIELHCVVLF